jgi:hypothetical protein
METAFQAELDLWGDYFLLVGTGAVTLLGLLFIAVSLRPNIFRDKNVADVQDFTRLTLFCFLAPMAISGLALMPHEHPQILAFLLFVVSSVGVAASIFLAREWVMLNQGPQKAQSSNRGMQPGDLRAWVYMAIVSLAYLALSIVAVLLLAESGFALAAMAGVQGWMVLTGTVNAWIVLTNAGSD